LATPIKCGVVKLEIESQHQEPDFVPRHLEILI
jgi:hypothetical protein